MQRRQFLKVGALGTSSVGLVSGIAKATPPESETRHLVVIHARGGWDPRFVCQRAEHPEHARGVLGYRREGGLRYALLDPSPARTGLPSSTCRELMPSQRFFARHGRHTLAIHGLDLASEVHDVATRRLLAGEGTSPQPLHLRLAERQSQRALGYSKVAPPGPGSTALEFGSVDPRDGVALGEHRDPDALRLPDGVDRVDPVRQGRLARRWPTFEQEELADLERFVRRGFLTLTAFRAGHAATAHLELGGFETEAEHDRRQTIQLSKLYRGIDALWTEAERLGLHTSLSLLVVSEAGRAETYVTRGRYAGKARVSKTVALLIGASAPRGGRTTHVETPAALHQLVEHRLWPDQAGTVHRI